MEERGNRGRRVHMEKERYGGRRVEERYGGGDRKRRVVRKVNMTYTARRVTTRRDKRTGDLLEPTKKMEKSVKLG